MNTVRAFEESKEDCRLEMFLVDWNKPTFLSEAECSCFLSVHIIAVYHHEVFEFIVRSGFD